MLQIPNITDTQRQEEEETIWFNHGTLILEGVLKTKFESFVGFPRTKLTSNVMKLNF